MGITDVHELSERYTALSDRFRSLWTFFQFLAGVYKHKGEGPIPYDYDFQGLYERIQALVPQVTGEVAGKGRQHLGRRRKNRAVDGPGQQLPQNQRGNQPQPDVTPPHKPTRLTIRAGDGSA